VITTRNMNTEIINLFLFFSFLQFSTSLIAETEIKEEKAATIEEFEFKKANTEYSKGNKIEAFQLYKSSCEKNFAKACGLLGSLEYSQGQRNEETINYLKKACQLNYGLGCFSLAAYYSDKNESTKSLTEAAKSCNLKVYQGCHLAGVLSKKLGNESESKKFFNIGCDNNYMNSCSALGVMEKEGSEKSTSYLNKACNSNFYPGCLMLAYSEVKLNRKAEALKFFKKSCEHVGNPINADFNSEMEKDACHGYALIELELGNPKIAYAIFEKNCNAGYSESCSELKKSLKK